MPSAGTSRGYSGDSEDDAISSTASPYEMHEQDGPGHEDDGHDAHHAPANPAWIAPTDSSFDDVYITSGGRVVDPGPVGQITPLQAIDALTPPPLAYAIDWGRLLNAWFWATMVFTPLWYIIYFGYRDSCFDIGLLLGAFFNPQLDGLTRLIGLGVHFGVSLGFAVAYAYALFIFRTQSSGGRGMQYAIGVCMAMTTFGLSLFVAFVARFTAAALHFDMPDMFLAQAGPANVGYGPFIIALMAHVFYGMILGGLYRHRVLIRQSDTLPAMA